MRIAALASVQETHVLANAATRYWIVALTLRERKVTRRGELITAEFAIAFGLPSNEKPGTQLRKGMRVVA